MLACSLSPSWRAPTFQAHGVHICDRGRLDLLGGSARLPPPRARRHCVAGRSSAPHRRASALRGAGALQGRGKVAAQRTQRPRCEQRCHQVPRHASGAHKGQRRSSFVSAFGTRVQLLHPFQTLCHSFPWRRGGGLRRGGGGVSCVARSSDTSGPAYTPRQRRTRTAAGPQGRTHARSHGSVLSRPRRRREPVHHRAHGEAPGGDSVLRVGEALGRAQAREAREGTSARARSRAPRRGCSPSLRCLRRAHAVRCCHASCVCAPALTRSPFTWQGVGLGLRLGGASEGAVTAGEYLMAFGLFGFAGGATNWIAIVMLFDEIPGVFGSGIIPKQFKVRCCRATAGPAGVERQERTNPWNQPLLFTCCSVAVSLTRASIFAHTAGDTQDNEGVFAYCRERGVIDVPR